MKIECISIHIETEDTAVETVFTSQKKISELMSGNDKFSDLILDIINNAVLDKD